jgi:hypothetical protein
MIIEFPAVTDAQVPSQCCSGDTITCRNGANTTTVKVSAPKYHRGFQRLEVDTKLLMSAFYHDFKLPLRVMSGLLVLPGIRMIERGFECPSNCLLVGSVQRLHACCEGWSSAAPELPVSLAVPEPTLVSKLLTRFLTWVLSIGSTRYLAEKKVKLIVKAFSAEEVVPVESWDSMIKLRRENLEKTRDVQVSTSVEMLVVGGVNPLYEDRAPYQINPADWATVKFTGRTQTDSTLVELQVQCEHRAAKNGHKHHVTFVAPVEFLQRWCHANGVAYLTPAPAPAVKPKAKAKVKAKDDTKHLFKVNR